MWPAKAVPRSVRAAVGPMPGLTPSTRSPRVRRAAEPPAAWTESEAQARVPASIARSRHLCIARVTGPPIVILSDRPCARCLS